MSIKFENVFFTYQENTPFCTHALNNINLEINDNEFDWFNRSYWKW